MKIRRFALIPTLLTISTCSLLLLLGTNPLRAGKAAPDFTLPSLSGEAVSLSDFGERPVLLTFWSSSCPPCREELPVLADLEEDFTAQGLTVMTVSVDSSPEPVRDVLQEANVDLLTLLDEDSKVMRAYGVSSTPTTYLIDEGGMILMLDVGYGERTEERLRDEIRQALGGG